MSHDTITLKSMRFHTLIGVYEHERSIPQPLEIDLSVSLVPLSTGDVADSSDIVDYTKLYDMVARVVNSGHIEYIEEIAERIASGALATPNVSAATVAVRKPHVALPGPLDYTEIRITRPRPLSDPIDRDAS